MKITDFIEELLDLKLKEYQKIAIENFNSDKNQSNKRANNRYSIVNSHSEVENDGFYGSVEVYYIVQDNETSKKYRVHESRLCSYGL